MASGSSTPTAMEQEVLCPICLDCLNEPVTLECGHNFCQGCITDYCDTWKELGALECPVCKAEIQKVNFIPNWQLRSLITKMKQTQFPAKPPEVKYLCSRHKQQCHFFCKDDEEFMCRICEQSPEHRGHSLINLEEAAPLYKDQTLHCLETLKNEREKFPASKGAIGQKSQEALAFGAARKERVCQKHQEPLRLFCKDDEALICLVCDRSKEHRDHETLPLEEASQEYKDQFCNCMEILKKEKEKVLVYESNIIKESMDMLKQTTGEKQETVAKFRQLHTFLEEQEKLLLAQMKEVEKEVERRRDQDLAELSEALSSLESLIREMEEKCQQPAGDLLQDARSTLQRYEEKEAFVNPAAFLLSLKWRLWDFSDLNLLLEGIRKQLKDTFGSGLHLQKANVTLDPDTAHPQLILSEGRKSVREGEAAQALPDNPERFDRFSAVLGREGFTGGRHFWEVLVESEEECMVGVARKSVRRKGGIFSPGEGIWTVGKWGGSYGASVKGHCTRLTVSGRLKRIRVCLNCAGRRVAFFDADRATLLQECSEGSFSGETLLPFFWVRNKGHLRIS